MTDTMGVHHDGLTLWTGTKVSLESDDDWPDEFDLRDIAVSLARQPRYNGCYAAPVDFHYSVAEHSVLCARLSAYMGHPLRVQLAVLLHDAVEMITGDVTRPVKMQCPEMVALEHRMQSWLIKAKPFSDAVWHQASIKHCDRAILRQELLHFYPTEDHTRRSGWSSLPMLPSGFEDACQGVVVTGWNADAAFRMFIAQFGCITSALSDGLL